jgi:hypothetical protein
VTVLPELVAIAGFVTIAFRFRGCGRYQRPVLLLVVASIGCVAAAIAIGHGLAGAIVQATIAWGIVAFLEVKQREVHSRWHERAANPLVLAPPFEGRWRVVAGGASLGRNHHLIASDQIYAYDFVREDAVTAGSSIIAPVAGVVVGARDGMPDRPPRNRVYDERERPFGNYVAIDSGRGVVMLAHLREGSVRVAAGDVISAGTPVGLCGNSGRTTIPHLHIHAQDRSEEATFVAQAVPIAFGSNGSPARLLAAGDCLETATRALPDCG